MKKRQICKRLAAWTLTFAMVFGNSSFAALAEEVSLDTPAAEVQETALPEAEEPTVEQAAELTAEDGADEEPSGAAEAAGENIADDAAEEAAELVEAPESDLPVEAGDAAGSVDSDEIIEEAADALELNLTDEVTVDDVVELAEGEDGEGTGEENQGEEHLDFANLRDSENYYTWVYNNEDMVLRADTSRLDGDENYSGYKLEWKIGIQTIDSGWNWGNAFTEKEYSVNTDGSVTLHGAALWEKVNNIIEKDQFIGIQVAAVNSGGEEFAWANVGMDVREPFYDYHYSEEEHLLPGWTKEVDKTLEYYYEDSSAPNGAEGKVDITNLQVESYEWSDKEKGWVPATDEVMSVTNEDWGWHLEALSYGRAVVTITHETRDGENQTQSFELYVDSEIYTLEWEYPNGSDQLLANGSDVYIGSWLYREYRYGDDGDEYYVGNYRLEIQEDGYDSKKLTARINPHDGQTVIVTPKVNVSGETDIQVDVQVPRLDDDGNYVEENGEVVYETVHTESLHINIADSYYYINIGIGDGNWKSEDNNPNLGGILDLNTRGYEESGPYLICVTSQNSTGQQVDPEQCRISVDNYDTNAWKLQEGTEDEAIPVLIRTGEWKTSISLVAEINTAAEGEDAEWEKVAYRTYQFPRLFYDVSFNEEPRGGDSSWILTDENMTLSLNTKSLSDYNMTYGTDYTIDWTVGTTDENGNYDRLAVETTNEQEGQYTVNKDGSITLFGEALVAENSAFSAHDWLDVCAIVKSVSDPDIIIFEGGYPGIEIQEPSTELEFQYRDGVEMLPEEWLWIDRYFRCYIQDKDNPFREQYTCEITNVSAVNDDDCEALDCKGMYKDENGWGFDTVSCGHAEVTVTYDIIVDENNRKEGNKLKFDVYVNGDIYSLELSSSTGTNQLLPGASLDLTAELGLRYWDEENGAQDGDTSDVRVEWSCNNEGYEEVVSFKPDSTNDRICHVTGIAEGNVWIEARVMVYNEEDGEWQERAYNDLEVWVNNSYYQLEAGTARTQRLEPGQTVEIDPTLYLYEAVLEGENKKISVDSDVIWRWEEWDDSVLAITDSGNNELSPDNPSGTAPFTIEKLNNEGTNILLAAYLDGNEDGYVAEEWWSFESLDYDTNFENLRADGYTWMYTDEMYTVSLNMENLKNSDIEVEWQVGSRDEYGEFTATMTPPSATTAGEYTEEDGYIILDGSKVRTWLDNNVSSEASGFDVCAIIYANGVEVSRAETNIGLCEPVKDYEFEYKEDVYCLPGQGIGIPGTVTYYEDSKDWPYGYWDEVAVTDVEVTVDEGYPKAVTCDRYTNDDDSYFWSLYPHSTCEATVKVTYQTINDEEDFYEFRYIILEEQYDVHLTSDPENAQLLPGETLTLTAGVSYDNVNDELDDDDVSDAKLEWVVEQDKEFITIEYDKSTDRTIFVTANSAGDAKIIVTAYRDSDDDGIYSEGDEFLADNEIGINVNNFQIRENDGLGITDREQYLLPGESVTIYPCLMQVNGADTGEDAAGEVGFSTEDEEPGDVDDNSASRVNLYKDAIYYRWEYDDNMLGISPDEVDVQYNETDGYAGPAFEITKLEEGWTSASLIAEVYDEDGGRYEVCRREWYFNEVDRSIWFDTERGGDYTWVYSNEKDYTLKIDTPEGLLTNGRELKVSVGLFTDDSDFAEAEIEGIGLNENGNTVEIDGTAIAAWLKTQKESGSIPEDAYPVIQADVVAPSPDGDDTDTDDIPVIASNRIGIDLREPVKEWEDGLSETEEDAETYAILLGSGFGYDSSKIHLSVENADYPNGEEFAYSLTNITVSGSDVENMFEVTVPDDNGDSFVKAMGVGAATLEYTVDIGEGGPITLYKKVVVLGSKVFMGINGSENTDRMLRGQTQRLLVNVFSAERSSADDDLKITQFTPDEDYTLEFRSDDPDRIAVTKDGYITVADDENAQGEVRIVVTATINREGEETSEITAEKWFYINDYYYQIQANSAYSVKWGESVEITPEIICVGSDDVFSGSVKFEVIESGSNELNISDPDENGTYTITASNTASEDESACGQIRIRATGYDDYGYPLEEEFWCDVFICNHEPIEDEWTVSVWPDCETEGERTQVCAKCGYRINEEELPALGHAWDDWDITEEATCTENGSRSHVCSRCDFDESEVIPAAGHTLGAWTVIQNATCATAGTQVRKCTECDYTESQTIPVIGHKWSAWQTTSEATVFAPATQKRTCTVCGTAQTQTVGAKLPATMTLTANSLKMKKKQSTTKFKVTDMANGDYLASVISSNTKVLKVSSVSKTGTFKLTAQKKTGKATLTIKLASGLTKTVKVTVQSGTVKTTKISGLTKNLTILKKQKVTLAPIITPVTSQQKVTYKTSNKKVATVNSKGVITGKKAGKAKITVKSGSKKYVVTVTVK